MNIKIILSFFTANQDSKFGGCNGDCACENGGCDGDCACSPANPPGFDGFRHSGTEAFLGEGRQFAATSFHQISQLHSIPLPNNEEIIYSPQARATLAVINAPARRVLDFFAAPRSLMEWERQTGIPRREALEAARLFHRGGFLEEAAAADRLPSVSPARTTTLEAWLFLTRACNLACAHCFVGKDTRCMNLETGSSAIRRLFDLASQGDFRGVKVKYAGGEPTLNWALIPVLHEEGAALSSKSGIPFKEVLVTNATTLSKERLQFIKGAGLHLSISLDGFGAGHDAQRPTVGGQRSFEKVIEMIETAIAMGIPPFLTMTLTSLNLSDLPAVTKFAVENNLYLNMNFYRPHQADDHLVPEHKALTETVLAAFDVIKANPPAYRLIDGLIDRSNFGFAHQYVCGAGRGYMSIDTDGRVSPCHMLTGQDSKELAFPLESAGPTFDGFENPRVDARTGCETCQWRYWCGGGCPILTDRVQGTVNTSSPYCDVYQALYPELLRLESARLLKYGDQAELC